VISKRCWDRKKRPRKSIILSNALLRIYIKAEYQELTSKETEYALTALEQELISNELYNVDLAKAEAS